MTGSKDHSWSGTLLSDPALTGTQAGKHGLSGRRTPVLIFLHVAPVAWLSPAFHRKPGQCTGKVVSRGHFAINKLTQLFHL